MSLRCRFGFHRWGIRWVDLPATLWGSPWPWGANVPETFCKRCGFTPKPVAAIRIEDEWGLSGGRP